MRGIHIGKTKMWTALCMMFLCASLCAGCSNSDAPDNINQNSIVIDKDGRITSYIVTEFDEEYYDLDDLKKMMQEEIAAHNTSNQTGENAPVVLESVDWLEGSSNSVIVTHSYDCAATYESYTGNKLFYGTIQEAASAGYDFDGLNQMMFAVGGNSSMNSGELDAQNMQQKHIIILTDIPSGMPTENETDSDFMSYLMSYLMKSTKVYCPANALYISEDSEAVNKKEICTSGLSDEASPTIIVLEK